MSKVVQARNYDLAIYLWSIIYFKLCLAQGQNNRLFNENRMFVVIDPSYEH